MASEDRKSLPAKAEKKDELNAGKIQSIDDGPLSETSAQPDLPKRENDQGLLPHATATASKVIEVVTKEVETVVDGAVHWVEKKVNELNVDDSTGPYSSPGTCAPSDLDAIANGILPAMPEQETGEKKRGQGGVQKPVEQSERE